MTVAANPSHPDSTFRALIGISPVGAIAFLAYRPIDPARHPNIDACNSMPVRTEDRRWPEAPNSPQGYTAMTYAWLFVGVIVLASIGVLYTEFKADKPERDYDWDV